MAHKRHISIHVVILSVQIWHTRHGEGVSRGRLCKEFPEPWFAFELFGDIRSVVVIAINDTRENGNYDRRENTPGGVSADAHGCISAST